MLYVMAGEDESKDLQEGEDSYYRRLVSEEGGFGSNTNSGFNSQESTDVDSRDAIASFGDDSDYDMVDRDDEEDDDNFDGNDEDFDNDAEDFDGDDDDYDEEYGYDDYDDDDEDEEVEEDEDENDEDDDEDGEGGGKGKKGKKDKNQKGKGNGADKGQFTKVKKRKISPEEHAAMKAKKDEIFAKMLGVKFIWHEGEKITLETLQQYWTVFAKHVESLRELMKEADMNVDAALSASTGGPNLILKINKYISVLGGAKSGGTIQSILNLIGSSGFTLVCGVAASVASIFTQQWAEVALIFALKAGLTLVLKEDFVQGIMNHIFSKGMKELKKKFNYKGIVVAPK